MNISQQACSVTIMMVINISCILCFNVYVCSQRRAALFMGCFVTRYALCMTLICGKYLKMGGYEMMGNVDLELVGIA